MLLGDQKTQVRVCLSLFCVALSEIPTDCIVYPPKNIFLARAFLIHHPMVEDRKLRDQKREAEIELGLSLFSQLSLGKLLNSIATQFSHLWDENDDRKYLVGLSRG